MFENESNKNGLQFKSQEFVTNESYSCKSNSGYI